MRAILQQNSEFPDQSHVCFGVGFSTYPKRRTQSLNIGLVDFADAGECGAQHGMIVLVDALLNEVRRLVLKLLVCREVVSRFFSAVVRLSHSVL